MAQTASSNSSRNSSASSLPQRLRNGLAVAVYEAHGRAALEYGDLAEFNQCQTQLHAMYADKQPGNVAEFTAYKVRTRWCGRNIFKCGLDCDESG